MKAEQKEEEEGERKKEGKRVRGNAVVLNILLKEKVIVVMRNKFFKKQWNMSN